MVLAMGEPGQAQNLPVTPADLPAPRPDAAAPAFAPNGKTVYFGERSEETGSSIMVSRRQDGGWSRPEPASFSGRDRDLEPAFAPNGRYLVFASNRAAEPMQARLDGHYNGQILPQKGGNLWRVDLIRGVSGKPYRLPDVINTLDSVFSPALTADGSLYFMRADDGKNFHIFRSQSIRGKFAVPTPAAFSDAHFGEFDPAVAPDESFVVFSSGRPPAPKTIDLFITFRTGAAWSEPIDLRTAVSPDAYGLEARLSPDARTLYFTNSRSPSGATEDDARYFWQVDLSPLLRAHGIEPGRRSPRPA